MSANPDKRASDDPATTTAEEAVAAVDPAAEPAPSAAPQADPLGDLFAEPPSVSEPATVAPAPEAAPEPEPEPAPVVETVSSPTRSRVQPQVRERVRTPPATPALDPIPSLDPPVVRRAAPVVDAGAAGFDAAFEARSETGLGDRLTPTICYVMMMAAPLTLGLLAVPAAFLAYMNKDTAPAWIRTHFLFQIRTFWIGTLMALLAAGTFLFFDHGVLGVGFGALWGLILVLGVPWFVMRAFLGLAGRLRRGEAIDNYRTWWV
jgi:uncharacterized membrane protein